MLKHILIIRITLLLILTTGCGDPGSHSGSDMNADGGDLRPDSTIDAVADANPTDDASTDAIADMASDTHSDTLPELPTFHTCTDDNAAAITFAGDFRHTLSEITVAIGDPSHHVADVLTTPRPAYTLEGKFAYGDLSKDLEDEDVTAWLYDCSSWRAVGTDRTNGDGRSNLPLAGTELPANIGAYDLIHVVEGDGSTVKSRLDIVPVGSKIVVFDIDGTMTTSDGELTDDIVSEFFEPILTGDYVPVAWPGAVELTRTYEARGYVIVYITGRPYYLHKITREWLQTQGFAPGHLRLTQDTLGEALPTNDGVGQFKLDALQALQSEGLVIEYAYGNATTDAFAYTGAGLDLQHTFIIGENGGAMGTQDLGITGYTDHLSTFMPTVPDAAQPFATP